MVPAAPPPDAVPPLIATGGSPPIRGAGLARPSVVLTVVPAMVLVVGLFIGLIGWVHHVSAARNMAEARLEDAWRAVVRELDARFGGSDALLDEVESAARRLDGSEDPVAWYRALTPLFAGRPELSYASFSSTDGKFFGIFPYDGVLTVNFNAQDGGGHRRRWRVSDDVATLTDDTLGFAYDPRGRPFWAAAEASDAAVWTLPYRFIGPSPDAGITRARAVRGPDHGILGVATVDWTTVALSASLTASGLGIADRVIVATSEGQVVIVCGSQVPRARSSDAPVEQVQDLADPLARALFAPAVGADGGLFEVRDPGDGSTRFAIRRRVPAGLDWTLALAARRDPLLAPARRHLVTTALAVAVFLPVALLLAWIFARHVLRVNRAVLHARDAASAAEAEAQGLRIEQERQRLEQLSTLGLLAGGIAHDNRNSICGVTAVADLLRARAGEPTQVLRYADLLARSGSQANQLCDDLLRFARKGAAKPADYDAHAAVRSAVNVFGTTGRSVTVDLAPLTADRHHVHGERGLLESAILNLCLNARDAMGGQGVVTISSSVREVTAADAAAERNRALVPGPHLRLTVADGGSGMDAEALSRCLEPRFSTKGELGTGLGLVTVQRAVHEHRGALEISSTLGQGTSISLVLPLIAAPSA
jgi:signal transduction histidine kinase